MGAWGKHQRSLGDVMGGRRNKEAVGIRMAEEEIIEIKG